MTTMPQGWYSCARKRPYVSRKQALGTATGHMKRGSAVKLKTYRCLTCGMWHLCKDKKALR